MSVVTCFSPIANESANILILGSMPGLASLNAIQYYAHPRNGFWRIMAGIYGFNAFADYETRVNCLIQSKVAVWDVLQSCERPGSLDSAIVSGSRIANDFESFFERHSNIRLIGFNGSEAENSFKKLVLNKLDLIGFNYIRLPSSSPANTLSIEQKTLIWKKALLKE